METPRVGTDIWTIGHWTCPEEVFIGMLRGEGIAVLADIRSAPGSRTSPQYNREAMREWLDRAGIDYVHIPELGGRRRRDPDAGETNAGWHNASFRNYADYTRTADYERGIATLTTLAREHSTAYLCAEPMPWRCHRLLVSNTLAARGWTVHHIMAGHDSRVHDLGRWGATPRFGTDGVISYPDEGGAI